jgi:hypothetical protein
MVFFSSSFLSQLFIVSSYSLQKRENCSNIQEEIIINNIDDNQLHLWTFKTPIFTELKKIQKCKINYDGLTFSCFTL